MPRIKWKLSISESEINNFWNDESVVLRNVLNEEEIKIYGKIIRSK